MALRRELGSGLTESPDYPDLSKFRMVELPKERLLWRDFASLRIT